MSSVVAEIDTLEKVSQLYLKDYKPAEIGRALDLTPRQVRYYISEYKSYISHRVEEDPEFLDRLENNTMEALERLGMLIKEAWDTYETAKNNDLVAQQTNLLKVAGDFEDKRAKLLQLMGAKVDSGMTARMQRAERVNDIVSNIIKEIVSKCDVCKIEVAPRLAEAFAVMNREEEAVDMEPVDVEDAEIIEQEDTAAILADVIAVE